MEKKVVLVCEVAHKKRKPPLLKKVAIEYLYLDLSTCERCIATDALLDEVVNIIAPTLKLAGYEIDYRKIEIANEKLAFEYSFHSSPTIRVNGIDIGGAIKENYCGCCSDIGNDTIACRTFEYEGETYDTPPKGMLAYNIMLAVFGAKSNYPMAANGYEIPENLRLFFAGKEK